MNAKQMKLENPLRLEELKMEETLKKIGLEEDKVLCDIGAGSGIFTIPGAKITKETVYALDINDEMLSIIAEKAKTEGIDNIKLIKVEDEHFNLTDHAADIVLMVTVLHEISNTTVFLEEVKRILKDKGRIAVIEFHKRRTSMGPPPEQRLGSDEVSAKLTNTGFKVDKEFDLGDNYYCLVFTAES